MRKFFELDNPVSQFLGRMGDLIVLNALFLVCSVPLVTIGASLTAMIKVIQGYQEGLEPKLFPTFFRAFRQNFLQATAAWLLAAGLTAGFAYYYLLIDANFTGWYAMALKTIAVLLMAVVVGTAGYLFPLIARYTNSLRRTIRNAAILAAAQLPRTLCMAILNILPAALFLFVLPLFLYSMIVWLLIGFSLICWLDGLLLRPVLKKLEKPEGS